MIFFTGYDDLADFSFSSVFFFSIFPCIQMQCHKWMPDETVAVRSGGGAVQRDGPSQPS
jgi:hypothetical protein